MKAHGKVPRNKAIRDTMAGDILNRASSMDVMGDSASHTTAAKAKPKPKPKGQTAKEKREKTTEQKARIQFDKDLAQSFGSNRKSTRSQLRIQGLAIKARTAASTLNQSGIQHQEARSSSRLSTNFLLFLLRSSRR